MPLYIRKEKADIIRHALEKLEQQTPIKAIGPGSVARAFTEAIASELNDMYDALDFNIAQSVISTANGSALDKLGELYGVTRRRLGDTATTEAQVGRFAFFLESVHTSDITIPRGTRVYTDASSFIGRQMSFETTAPVTIPTGRIRVFAPIKPVFADSVFTAGVGTLTVHDFTSPPGVIVRCTNEKPIQPQPGFESDNNFRIRIMKSVRVAASGTAEAMRFAALGVPGVRDVKIRQSQFGLGSVEVLVTPEEKSIKVSTMDEVSRRIQEVRPVGIRVRITEPTRIAVDVGVTIHMRDQGSTAANERLAKSVKVGILRYLNSLNTGEKLVYNRLLQTILNTSRDIRDAQITRYAPNAVEVLRRNYEPEPNELLIPGNITIAFSV